jgi:F-type H+-transporting ATPase subunit epsilon
MADTIKLDLVTPEKLMLSDDFDMVTATSVLGEFGVLPGHAPLLALLRPGIVVAKRGSEELVYATQSGIAEVEPDRMIILTEKAAAVKDIDIDETERDLAKAEEEAKAWTESTDSFEYKIMYEKLEWLRARLRAATRSGS